MSGGVERRVDTLIGGTDEGTKSWPHRSRPVSRGLGRKFTDG
jgi:hypothetical protein